MSMNLKGKTCPVCHAYFFEDEDVVYCPVCGLPHHRSCYNSLGHCALDALHGTDQQYNAVIEPTIQPEETTVKPDETAESVSGTSDAFSPKVRCPKCQAVYPLNDDACPNCGTKNALANRFTMFDLLGGVKENEPVSENITANEARSFVLSSTARIIPKFRDFFHGKKISFSFWSFFFPTARFAARKMYLAALASGTVETAAMLLTYPLYNQVYINEGIDTYEKMQTYLQASISGGANRLMWLALVGVALMLILRIICGIFSDYWYYKHTVSTINDLHGVCEDDDELADGFRRRGGINFFGFLIAFVILQYLPGLIAMFIL